MLNVHIHHIWRKTFILITTIAELAPSFKYTVSTNVDKVAPLNWVIWTSAKGISVQSISGTLPSDVLKSDLSALRKFKETAHRCAHLAKKPSDCERFARLARDTTPRRIARYIKGPVTGFGGESIIDHPCVIIPHALVPETHRCERYVLRFLKLMTCLATVLASERKYSDRFQRAGLAGLDEQAIPCHYVAPRPTS